MKKPDAKPITVADAAAVQPRFAALEQLTPEQFAEFQREWQAVLLRYQQLRAERIRSSH